MSRSASLLKWWFVLLLCTGLLSWVCLPVVPEIQGNQRLSNKSQKALLSSEWLRESALWLKERLPLRYHSIQWRNGCLFKLAKLFPALRINPGNNSVSVGKNGWLFFDQEAAFPPSRHTHRQTAEDALTLTKRIHDSGRRCFFMPIPDKISIYPDYASPLILSADSWSRRAEIPQELRKIFVPHSEYGFVDLWRLFDSSRRESEASSDAQELWCPHDTHWNSRGAALAVQHLLQVIQPGITTPSSFQAKQLLPMVNDLVTSLLSLPEKGQLAPHYTVVDRPAAKLIEKKIIPDIAGTPILTYQSAAQPVIPGKTLLIMDSFMQSTQDLMAPWFEEITFIHDRYANHEVMLQKIAEADTIIWTSVERLLRGRLSYWKSEPSMPKKRLSH